MKHVFLLFFLMINLGCLSGNIDIRSDNIYIPRLTLSVEDKKILAERIRLFGKRYDDEKCMLLRKIGSWNYHTDAVDTTYHEVRGSLHYAVALMDYGGELYSKRALDILRAVLPLQDKDTNSKSCGVWPYYLEEPLHSKKSPIDYNWADFNAVSLLDIYMFHYDVIPEDLKLEIKNSLLLAANVIKKRNCGPSYTNIAIMGTYVTYMVANLFNVSSMKEYSEKRLKEFYDYTIRKKGFTEYNSPTYTMVGLEELNRMQRHVIEPEARSMINELYYMAWNMVARHYHVNSGQWAGPHSRAYPMLVEDSFYDILHQCTNGKISGGKRLPNRDVKIKHVIPDKLLHYFIDNINQQRTEIDTFEIDTPQVTGHTFFTKDYVLGSASHSCMWVQRRPFTAYWGTRNSPSYMRVRLLHDFYDFSSGLIQTVQEKNRTLSAITFMKDGGDKHISIDRISNGIFRAKDLRIRIELYNCKDFLFSPIQIDDVLSLRADSIYMNIYPIIIKFDDCIGRWETGYGKDKVWLDYVFYSGKAKDFDFTKIKEAIFSFALEMDILPLYNNRDNISYNQENDKIFIKWENLNLKAELSSQQGVRNY